jgi:hypothetical protein
LLVFEVIPRPPSPLAPKARSLNRRKKRKVGIDLRNRSHFAA